MNTDIFTLKQTLGIELYPPLFIVLMFYIRITCRHCDQYLVEHDIIWSQVDCCWRCAFLAEHDYKKIFGGRLYP